MEETRRYYITLQAGVSVAEIREDEGNSHYDFVIEATPEQINHLNNLLFNAANADDYSFLYGHIPFSARYQQENIAYDQNLDEVYRMIYRLGTEETKRQLQNMGMNNFLKYDEKWRQGMTD